jgi:hypothetical protein
MRHCSATLQQHVSLRPPAETPVQFGRLGSLIMWVRSDESRGSGKADACGRPTGPSGLRNEERKAEVGQRHCAAGVGEGEDGEFV